ncbi:galactokinase family protein [Clostridium sp. BJN0001]|uniref:galactokinase n=1 Tax=Clostridium sp. BJN0001 TaxID=2930219 RepID=UPI001FCF8D23|nr:galactokinase family protein [Clostridium sp. BJN0001]
MNNSKQLLNEFENKKYDDILKDIYVDENVLDYQRKRYIDTIKKYKNSFSENDIEIFSAPGRSEVCGNHTDHQHGMVLATSINLDAIAIVSLNDENTVKVISDGYDMIKINLNDLDFREDEVGTSKSLIRGVLKNLLDRGYKVSGFNAYMTSDVLVGAGLSSSAAFEVITGTIISGLFNNMKISPIEIAQASQFAENVYFKKPCGLMDQMACSVGGLINIDFNDPKKPIVNKVQVDFEKYKYSLCIVDTKGSHVDLTDDYAMIPSEMRKVADYFGKDVLREVDKTDFYLNIAKIRKEVGDRAILRAFHFFKEEENVEDAVKALRDENFEEFLDVIQRSGNSSFKYLQNVYSNSDVQAQNVSIALAFSEGLLKYNGVCRVHGGGFAGTIQAFVKNDFVDEYKEFIETIFGEGSCHILKIRKYGGIKVI